MAPKLGFATEYYTLWDCSTEPVYFTDSNGKHWHVRDKAVNNYVQNVSKDLDRARAAYPGVEVDEDLRGRTRSYSTENREEDLCPWILKFGKYCGRDVKDLALADLSYLVWLVDRAHYVLRQLLLELPQVVAELARQATEFAARVASHPSVASGPVTLTFYGNPNTPTLGAFDSEELGAFDSEELGEDFRERFRDTMVAHGSVGPGHNVAVIFPEVHHVHGLYPYTMAVIAGKAVKIKGRTLTLPLEVLHTTRYQDHCYQVAVYQPQAI